MKGLHIRKTFQLLYIHLCFIAASILLLHFNKLAEAMPAYQAYYATPIYEQEQDKGGETSKGVETVFVNINNLNLNMSILIPPWSSLYKTVSSSSVVQPVYKGPFDFEATEHNSDVYTGQGNKQMLLSFIDSTNTLYPRVFWWGSTPYQFLDVGSLRSQDTSQVAESGHEQYNKETRENEATTTTLDDNVKEVIDKNLLLVAASASKGENQKAPAGPTTTSLHPADLIPVLLLSFDQNPPSTSSSNPQPEARSVLGPGVSVACTGIGVGLALYSLGRTYRYLVPVWEGPFPFVDPFNSTLSNTWSSVVKAVDDLNLETIFDN